jgi:arylformamidase
MVHLIDVSVPIHPGMLTYPGDPTASVDRVVDMDQGETSNLSVLSMSTHTGTHVDPPIHFVANGATIDRVSLTVTTGPAEVVDMRGAQMIGKRELEDAGLPDATERVLFITDWSARWEEDSPAFPASYTALALDGARWLVERGIRLVGTDFISIEDADAGGGTYPVHRELLGSGVVIVEGLDLRETPAGRYTLWCLPLKIRDGDGGPARVILVKD